MNSKIIKHTYLLFLLIIFALMLCFNMLTPMVSDDFAHYYGVEDVHVTTVQGMLHSMGVFRIYANGRVISFSRLSVSRTAKNSFSGCKCSYFHLHYSTVVQIYSE